MAEKHAFDTDDRATPGVSGRVAAEGEQTGPEVPDYPMTIKAAGGSRLRLLLLLLVLVAAGGGYNVLMMSESTAPPPPPPPQVVAVVPLPATQPAPPPAPASVTPPPPASVAPALAEAPPAKPVATKVVAPTVSGGAWRVEAGTYQDSRAAQAAAEKIRGLGYEPQLRTAQKSIAMTRLRLGVFPASEVKTALAAAREVAPDAFALRSGENFAVYAGTFASPRSIRLVSAQLASVGVLVEEEPVMVKRTISLLQFDGFADQAAAAAAAARARQAGIAAEVVTPR
jgi:hypothetical protein